MVKDVFDIVDAADNVIGSAPRGEVHARGLMHRASHVIIFCNSPRGRMILLQKRSATKDKYPNLYTTSCSGHVDTGETYEIAAVREMREETGLRVAAADLHFVGKISACKETGNEFTSVYTLDVPQDTAFAPPPDEVASLDWRGVGEFEESIAAEPALYTPSFLKVYAFYLSKTPNSAK